MIPAIVHGSDKDPQPVALPQRDVDLALGHGQHLLDGSIDGESIKLLIKEVQYDYLGTTAIHMDLVRVSLQDRVEVTVPIEFRGIPAGVKDGGVIEHHLGELAIEVLVTDIPESIRVSVAAMEINSFIHVSDIEVPEGVKVLSRPEELVAAVTTVAEEEEPEPDAEITQPEVIGRVREEDEKEETGDKG